MNQNAPSSPTRLFGILARLGVAVFVVLIPVLVIFNPDRWRDFVFDLASSIIVQGVVALPLGGLAQLITRSILKRLGKFYSPRMRSGIGAVAISATLPVPSVVFHRPWDLYDVLQTIGLIIVFGVFADPLIHWIERRALRTLPREPSPVFSPAHPPSQTLSGEEQELDKNLLTKAGGNRGLVERLIAYERECLPHANRIELKRNAKERWERDRM